MARKEPNSSSSCSVKKSLMSVTWIPVTHWHFSRKKARKFVFCNTSKDPIEVEEEEDDISRKGDSEDEEYFEEQKEN